MGWPCREWPTDPYVKLGAILSAIAVAYVILPWTCSNRNHDDVLTVFRNSVLTVDPGAGHGIDLPISAAARTIARRSSISPIAPTAVAIRFW
ncbi:MAG: hypothetical protein [Caudoviricetes sp.]|nr:MAG: hypothetical protein [Caudoviricetes sp.]